MIELFSTLLIISCILYVIEFLFLYVGLERASRVTQRTDYEPHVSIIVAARNEEEYIDQCVHSLVEVNYPKDKLEIIVVNDRSTDATLDRVEQLTKKFAEVKVLSTTPGEGNLRGKANALSQGIAISHGEILMFTDADCTVPKTWVQETVSYFDDNTGIVGGFTLLSAARPFEGMQALDWIMLFGVASATAGWKIPLTAIGNNLSVRRSAYEQVGGFKQIPFSVTEDYALVQKILQKTQLKLRFPINSGFVVYSKPCRSWIQLYYQKQRWGVGGLDMVFRGILIMSAGWLFKVLLISGLFIAPFSIWLITFLSKCLMDVLFLSQPLQRFNVTKYMKHFIFFEIYYCLYVIVIPFIAILSKKVVWKERTL
jgi:cellulose synthase/poly-beta-1,6-N-acetylglucosamine synthase-like glycosyltransferase